MNFDVDKTELQRQGIIDRRAVQRSRGDGTSYTTAHLDNLRKAYLDLAELVLDDMQYNADTRQTQRALVGGAPEYRHEFLMINDPDYYNAWAYTFSDYFREGVEGDTTTMTSVNRGLSVHTYLESDESIVDRSLLRNGLRTRLEGESFPYSVVGQYAPRTSTLSRITRITTIGGIG